MAPLISLGFGALVGASPKVVAARADTISASSPGAAQSSTPRASLAAQHRPRCFPLSLGILLITQEFRHKTITATFLVDTAAVEGAGRQDRGDRS